MELYQLTINEARTALDKGEISKEEYNNTIGNAAGSASPNIQMVILEGNNHLNNLPDINGDGDINFGDYEFISRYWLLPCSYPNWCEGADLNVSGWVDPNDVRILAENWLGLP